MRCSFSWNKIPNYYLVIIIITIISTFPVLFNDFWFGSDDEWILLSNPQVFSLDFSTIIEYFTHFTPDGQYAPINTLAYGVLYYFVRLNPFWYHLLSLIFHLLNTTLVFVIIFKLTYRSSENFRKNQVLIAMITALAFGIHPMQVESLAWVAASKTILYSFFFLLAIWMYLQYINTNKRRHIFLTYLFFILSFGVKEQGVVFPVCLVAIDFILKRNVLSRSVLLEKLPFMLFAIAMGIISMQAQEIYAGKVFFEREYYPFWQRVVFACYSIFMYAFKSIVPFDLHPGGYFFPTQPGEDLPRWIWLFPGLFILAIVYFIRSIFRKQNIFVFASVFFISNIALTLHIIPMARRNMIADRYIYLSIIGIFFFCASALINGDIFKKYPIWVYSLLVLYFVSFAVLTNYRCRNWDMIGAL